MKHVVKKESAWKEFFQGLLGIVIFLIVLGLANLIIRNFDNVIANAIIQFLNQNLFLIIQISIAMLLADVFKVFSLPFNLPYPLFNAIGAVLWIELVFRILAVADSLVEVNLLILLPYQFIIALLIVIIVLIIGYAHIFAHIKEKTVKTGKKSKKKKKGKKKKPETIADEIRSAAHNIGEYFKEKK